RRNTLAYRSGKFVRRHAAAVVAALIVCVSLITTTVLASHQARAALESRRKAEIERARAEQVAAFLADLFKVADPAEARGARVTAREILDWSASRAHEMHGQPE